MRRILKALSLTIATTIGLLVIAWNVTPWTAVFAYRFLFDRGGAALNAKLQSHVPKDVIGRTDIAYGRGEREKLDIYWPSDVATSPQKPPVVIWIHGGAFLSGSKSYVANYAKILAAKGFAVAALEYTLAPDARHPGPVLQANAALGFLKANAASLNVDPDRIVIAGDSAGAHIAAELAIALSDPAFASTIGMEANVARPSIRALLLFCGVYKPALFGIEGKVSSYRKTVLWAYLDNTGGDLNALPKEFDIVANLPDNLPPVFITAGNADVLLPHSKALAEAAHHKGIETDTLFFPDDHKPGLEHEYQFELETPEAQNALARVTDFLRRHTE